MTELPNGYKEFNSSIVELIKTNATDEDVARAAWVSTVGEESKEKDPGRMSGLINYLMRDRHGSPFEHGSFTFFIKTPLFVRSEFHRHRVGWSYNEESGRYSQLQPHVFIIPDDRKVIQTGKVGHYKFENGPEDLVKMIQDEERRTYLLSYGSYLRQLNAGASKEVARQVLQLNQMTSFYATCNPRSLMHFLSLRTEDESATFMSHPQWEIQNVADQMEACFRAIMPLTHSSWCKNGRMAP